MEYSIEEMVNRFEAPPQEDIYEDTDPFEPGTAFTWGLWSKKVNGFIGVVNGLPMFSSFAKRIRSPFMFDDRILGEEFTQEMELIWVQVPVICDMFAIRGSFATGGDEEPQLLYLHHISDEDTFWVAPHIRDAMGNEATTALAFSEEMQEYIKATAMQDNVKRLNIGNDAELPMPQNVTFVPAVSPYWHKPAAQVSVENATGGRVINLHT